MPEISEIKRSTQMLFLKDNNMAGKEKIKNSQEQNISCFKTLLCPVSGFHGLELWPLQNKLRREENPWSLEWFTWTHSALTLPCAGGEGYEPFSEVLSHRTVASFLLP